LQRANGGMQNISPRYKITPFHFHISGGYTGHKAAANKLYQWRPPKSRLEDMKND
jgi:hypothetical protein